MKRRFAVCLIALLGVLGLMACGEAPAGPPRPLMDRDGDGIANSELGGRDCRDDDPNIPGGLEETPGDKIDNNCNGQIDEIWAKTGYWRLTTVAQKDSRWDIDIQTNGQTALQHVSCLQFKFSLKSKKDGRIFFITQWQTGLPYTAITFKDNKFEWKLDSPERTLKITFTGQIVSPMTMTGTITVEDTDPQVAAGATLPFSGKFVGTALSKDDAEKEFCGRCYGDSTCKQP